MNSYEFDVMLFDRIERIKLINDMYNLEKNSYIAFSGGKDSTVLHYLIDLALPNNNIPRVFINTGIEYKDIVEFVKNLAINDSRFVILNPSCNIKDVLKKYGYPFKSKVHAHMVNIFQNNLKLTKSVSLYLNGNGFKSKFVCPSNLKYMFSKSFNLKISDKCCLKLKKEPVNKWAKDNLKTILLTGMRKAEGGQRVNLNCVVIKNDKLFKFHPLSVLSDSFIERFIEVYGIPLCNLYYFPYNFKRTGCKGCPFSLDLQVQLNKMKRFLFDEYNQCQILWKPVYDEYKRIKYRLVE